MAAGDRKVKIQEFHVSTGNPVLFQASWQLFIEDKLSVDRYITGGNAAGSFGSVATFNAKTGAQLKTDVRNAVIADINTPSNDSVT